MPRLFELRRQVADGEVFALVDLDKVCLVRTKKQTGHHFLDLLVRFVDGHEVQDLVPPDAVQPFLDAYRAYLREQSAK